MIVPVPGEVCTDASVPGNVKAAEEFICNGDHTFSVAATDGSGNTSSTAVTFTIVVTPESIQDAVRQLVDLGLIEGNEQATFLLGRLAAAAKQYHRGNCNAAAGVYGSFINALRAQSDKKVTPAAASIPTADAQYLIDHCPN